MVVQVRLKLSIPFKRRETLHSKNIKQFQAYNSINHFFTFFLNILGYPVYSKVQREVKMRVCTHFEDTIIVAALFRFASFCCAFKILRRFEETIMMMMMLLWLLKSTLLHCCCNCSCLFSIVGVIFFFLLILWYGFVFCCCCFP